LRTFAQSPVKNSQKRSAQNGLYVESTENIFAAIKQQGSFLLDFLWSFSGMYLAKKVENASILSVESQRVGAFCRLHIHKMLSVGATKLMEEF
jgi:hypothetical protein